MSPTTANSLNGSTEVIKLADLITAAVKEVVNEYQAAGHIIPSIFSTDSGPFDAPHLTSPGLNKAIQIIEAACAQLSYTVANPGHTVTNVFNSTLCTVQYYILLTIPISNTHYRKHMGCVDIALNTD